MLKRLLILVLLSGAFAGAQKAPSLDAQFQAAIHKETVAGDLKAAMADYRRIADAAAKATDRRLAAQALLRLAGCHEKLGIGSADAIFEELVRDYGDQPSAALARTRLRRQAAAASNVSEEVLLTGDQVPQGGGHISPDGKYLVYRNGRERATILRQLSTGAENVLVPDDVQSRPPQSRGLVGGGTVGYVSFSPDGRMLAYDWRVQSDEMVYDELRIVNVQTSGTPRARKVFEDRDTSGYSIRPYDWTPDARRIAVVVGRLSDRSRRVGFVEIESGKLTVLTTLEWRGPTRLSLSPDGNYLAYDVPVGERAVQRDIFVLAADGSGKAVVVEGTANDELVGWTPDGGRLVFVSDRGGQRSLWEQTLRGGKPFGPPALLRPAIGHGRLVLTRAGDLYHFIQTTNEAAFTATIDPVTGANISVASRPSTWATTSVARWSPDGKQRAYFGSSAPNSVELVLCVESLMSGNTRTLPSPLAVRTFDWMPDGSALLVYGSDSDGRSGLYRMDVSEARVTPIDIHPTGIRYARPQVSADGRRVLFWRQEFPNGRITELVARDLGGGREQVLHTSESQIATLGAVSPDGVWFGAAKVDHASKSMTLVVTKLGAPAGKELLTVRIPEEVLGGPVVEWTPDSAAVIIRKVTGPRQAEVWKIVVADGTATRLDLGVTNYSGAQVTVSPDGRQIGFQTSDPPRRELRVIHNLFGAAARRAPATRR